MRYMRYMETKFEISAPKWRGLRHLLPYPFLLGPSPHQSRGPKARLNTSVGQVIPASVGTLHENDSLKIQAL